MESNIKISNSVFSDEFQGIDSTEITLLNRENALVIWKKHVDKEASSYFSLADENWIVKSRKSSIGQWISDFNERKSERIEAILSSSNYWGDNDEIYFCISKYIVIQSKWDTFKKLWINFIDCGDNCPVIINAFYDKSAILFSPMGDIIKISPI